MHKLKVLANSSFIGDTGYNSHTREFFTALSKISDIDLKVRNYTIGKSWNEYNKTPHDRESYINQDHKDILFSQTLYDDGKRKDYPIYSHDPNFKPDVNIVLNEVNHHYFYDDYEGLKIAYNVWESTEYPKDFMDKILEYDQLWVPTEWQKQCSIKQGYSPDKVKVIPEAVDGTTFFPEDLKYDDDIFRFLVFGRWDYRKSINEIIESFLKTFNKNEKVELVLSVDNPFSIDGMKTTEERLKHYGFNDKRIKVIHFPSREKYIEYLKSGHVFVSCARSEGWNLPLIEAMACGTPAIYSNWGAQLEFAKGKGHPVNVLGEVRASSGNEVSYGMGKTSADNKHGKDSEETLPGNYCEPDYDDLGKTMRYIYDNYDECKEKALVDSKLIRKKFTWENAAKLAYNELFELTKKETQNTEKLYHESISDECFDDLYNDIINKNIYQKYHQVSNDNIVVDIGTSIGFFPKSLIDFKKCYCLEPSPSFFADLKLNLDGDKYVLINKAISNKTGHSYLSAETEIGHEVDNSDIKIEVITFSDFIKENNIDHIDFLKFDCEGGEYHIFTTENMDFINNKVDKMAGEIHLWDKKKSKKLIKTLKSLKDFDIKFTSIDGVELDNINLDYYSEILFYAKKRIKNEIVTILSYTDTVDKVNALLGCIDKIKSFGYKILLVSHYPVSEEIQRMVDYYLYDEHNEIIKIPITFWANMAEFDYICSDPAHNNHSYAILSLIRESLLFCRSMNFDLVHFINYDVILKDDIFSYNNYEIGARNALFYEYTYDGGSFNTAVFSIKPELDLFDKIETSKDYFDKSFIINDDHRLFLEPWIYGVIKNNDMLDNVRILEVEEVELKYGLEGIISLKNFYDLAYNNEIYVFIQEDDNSEHDYCIIYDDNKLDIDFEENNYKLVPIGNSKEYKILEDGIVIHERQIDDQYRQQLIDNTKITFKDNIEKLINKAYDVGMLQQRDEISDLTEFLKNKNIKNFLEIGTDSGGTFYIFTKIASGKKISLDIPHGKFGVDTFDTNTRDNMMNSWSDNVHIISGDSHELESLNQVKKILDGELLDLLFIDGDHTYNGVHQDYIMYSNLVREGGYIVFHDINDTKNHRDAGCSVSIFWNQLVGNKTEFNVKGAWGGIGLITKNNSNTINTSINTTGEELTINVNFVQGAMVDLLSDKSSEYYVEFIDLDNRETIHLDYIKNNMWTKTDRKWYTNWLIRIVNRFSNKTIHEHIFNLTNKKVYIALDSKSLGDTLAWMPYVEEFRKKHNCETVCSTFWNHFFKSVYKDIKFVEPGTTVHDLYAMYEIGIFDEDGKNPNDTKKIPLQKIATDILGLDYVEIKPKIHKKPKLRKIKEKYVCIAPYGTSQAKFWNYGWQEVVDYLNKKGYKVVLISKEESGYMNNDHPKNIINKSGNLDIYDRINDLEHADAFIGISSGLSWLAWATGTPVVMISGHTKPWYEFECERVINENVCNGCWHDHPFDAGDWNWCPKQKDFECTKAITSAEVLKSLNRILKI